MTNAVVVILRASWRYALPMLYICLAFQKQENALLELCIGGQMPFGSLFDRSSKLGDFPPECLASGICAYLHDLSAKNLL
jgi:hypothetical protein